MTRGRPIEVAIIGGGCAGVTAAFELTRPEHEGRYHVTVYQLGWRLGGKGASGRGPADRIQEHGLHLWMGFYENAFQLMRECYAELKRDPATCPIADWRDAFTPDPFNGVADFSPSGRWLPWKVHLPPFEGLPGEPGVTLPRWTVGEYLARTLELLRTLLSAIQEPGARPATSGTEAPASAPGVGSPEALLESMARLLKLGGFATLAAVVEALNLLEVALGTLRRYPMELLLRFHDAVASALRGLLEQRVAADDELRRLWEIADLVLAVVRGALRFRLVTDPRGFDAIDDYDCREWLRLNGASERSINSAFIRALYDLAFAYEDGDARRPRIAAGQALRGALRAFFTYRGAFFWKMRSGMGDIVFAPFYEVLKRRGASFAFFHRLESVRLSAGPRAHVEALEFDVQADVAGGGEYQPLVDVRGLPCWPAAPDWSQLVDGERLQREEWKFESAWDTRKAGTRVLRVGQDFDLAVLAVGGGAVRHVCGELVEKDPRWRAMVERVKTVPTQAFQVWLGAGMRELGWHDGPINLSGFVKPFDTWADMTHLASEESWRRPPRAIAYFCSVLPDVPEAERQRPAFPDEQHERVRRNAVRFLQRDLFHLWPRCQDAVGGFRWELLMDPAAPTEAPRQGEARFDSQYWTANVSPTERYTLSLPGSLRFRISPLDNTYDNLTVAGDWTDSGFNEGCVEAAVMSGRLAAHALSGVPRLEEIVGFDHP
ncbi:NAD(P)-binding protein [Pyxidicoccus parkwayensis]|uniref:NAD(P)-binding protein n=1 Tax=Pyxidicoccus parkwayensis TaxID=2813578 RepID=A0ABX7NVH9_9BACT|nr:FAD-dependent oxidoreductase [Pyxidicoccus parkwaysis]QSQ22359.1 NAD(P)-binding protein [Pyxidicoccus parkwaysis]